MINSYSGAKVASVLPILKRVEWQEPHVKKISVQVDSHQPEERVEDGRPKRTCELKEKL